MPFGTSISSIVLAFSLYDDGSGPVLYTGGEFGFAGGIPSSRLAKSVRLPKLNLPAFSHHASVNTATLPVLFHPADALLSSTTFSINYDETCFDPDIDGDGELDILLANLSGQSLVEGVLVEVGIPMDTLPTEGIDASDSPRLSMGTLTGGELVERVLLPTVFADGFESNSTSAWLSGVGN